MDATKISKKGSPAELRESGKVDERRFTRLKKAIEEDYDIYFHDESTLQLCANVIKTYSSRGKTPLLNLYDTTSWHKSEEVKAFLNTEQGKRIWVANRPPYSPEFNPDELVWANLKKVQIPNRVTKNV